MCGINGAFLYGEMDLKAFDLLRDTLKSRGPDSFGAFTDDSVYLGHRRLSIIDLDTGDQPMVSQSGRSVIIFNGEIYNYQELRSQLLALGTKFRTQSDTEVLQLAFETWGLEECLERIEGMFSFAIWDKEAELLSVVRDRYGEKPLYYLECEKGFFFASELKGLEGLFDKSNISTTGLNLYFQLSYIPAPYTIYNEVLKLEAGHYLQIRADGKVDHQYYDLKATADKSRSEMVSNYTEAQNDLRKLLFKSVENRMISDVPLGSFLSGGVDSSIISAIMSKISGSPIKTFSIGFKEKAYDESDRAQLVAEHIGSDHTLYMLDHHDLLEVVDETVSYFDEPFGDSSAIPSMMVAKKAREKVKVVLTGDCADELFGGYEKYLGKHYADKLKRFPAWQRSALHSIVNKVPHNNLTNHLLRKAKKVLTSADAEPIDRYIQLTSMGQEKNRRSKLIDSSYFVDVDPLVGKYFREWKEEDELSQTFYSDIKLLLEGDMLTKVDRATMLNSLEARVPFLDSQIVHYAFSLPHDFKIQGSNKKRILKDAFSDLLPEETLSFGKKGFGLPLRLWFQSELKEELVSLLDPELLRKQAIFNSSYIQKLLNEHFSGRENHSVILWLLFVFQKWYLKTSE